MSQAATAIEIRGVHKSFRVPTHRVETLKERITHPFRGVEFREFKALHDISLDIEAGSFVGIAGRNGSGKTTLLKLLASIYSADSGTIRIAGRVAPFIELGVGFNPDLAARDNILLNGVMMGLTPRESRFRADRVIEFAELEEFTELKLKNYSSGMRVRLGFAMLVEADADILLIDEVLAVGDAAFQQKCTDTFYSFKDEGRTIVLVTHAMEKLKEYCDSAVLLHEGKLDVTGDPDAVGDRYLDLNFKEEGGVAEGAPDAGPAEELEGAVRIVDFWLEDDSGRRAMSFAHGERINVRAVIEALEDVEGEPVFGFQAFDAHGARILHLRTPDLTLGDGRLEKGAVRDVHFVIDNPLGSGRYLVHIAVARHRDANDQLAYRLDAANFVVYGAEAPDGTNPMVNPAYEVEITDGDSPLASRLLSEPGEPAQPRGVGP